MDGQRIPTQPKPDHPVPGWIQPKEPWFRSLRESIRVVLGPKKIIRIKGIPAGDAGFRAPLLETDSDAAPPWYSSLKENLREVFRRDSAFDRPANPGGPALYRAPALTVEFGTWKESFGWSLRQLLRPDRLPQLPASAKNIKVEDPLIEPDRERARRAQALSLLVHATALVVMVIPFTRQLVQAQPTIVELVPTGIDAYSLSLPPSMKKSGGGGGGGDRSRVEASQGRLPKFSLQVPLAAPSTQIKNPDALLKKEPSVVVPEDALQNVPLPNLGDPLSNGTILSDGTGAGGGIGSGLGGGVGRGFGPGVGPGEGGGFGGGVFEVGGSVSEPACVYCPDPDFSEEARKAKYQGTVVLWTIIDENGRVRDIRVSKSLGLGLDEEAIRAVQNWIFRPAERYGKPVPVRMQIEVQFTLY